MESLNDDNKLQIDDKNNKKYTKNYTKNKKRKKTNNITNFKLFAMNSMHRVILFNRSSSRSL